MTSRKVNKTKVLSEDLNDLINESDYLKDCSMKKTIQKRKRNNMTEEEDITKLLGQFQTKSKKKKQELNVEACTESRQKILDVMSNQLEARKEKNESLLKFLSEFTTELEADYNAMKENEKKLEHLAGAVIKCMQQSTAAHKQNLKVVKEIHASYKKQCEEVESDFRSETEKLANELENDMRKLQEKLISETKRSGWETLRKTLFQAMQNDF